LKPEAKEEKVGKEFTVTIKTSKQKFISLLKTIL